jgi:hypothetical protein
MGFDYWFDTGNFWITVNIIGMTAAIRVIIIIPGVIRIII